MSLKIVCISDTHGLHHNISVPDGDILIHAGDLTAHGIYNELYDFNAYMGSLPHRYKILIAGNHDFCFEENSQTCAAILTNCIYLQDQAVTIEGIRFYGSPWQPWFYDWAFNLQRGPEIRQKWDLIPSDIDILITHGPPYGQGDKTSANERVGCEDLLAAVQRIRPKLHLFGHIHEGFGLTQSSHTTYINASLCNLRYKPVNPPIVYEY